jgi:hypothetical protein
MEFFSLWIGKSLSLYELLSLKSFYQNGKTLHLYCNPELQLPDFVKRKSISEVIDPSKVYLTNNSYASFSNYFRYLALSKIESGNTWVDLDILYLQDFGSNSGYVFGHETKKTINNAVLSAPANSDLIRELVNQSSGSHEQYWGATGPRLLTKLVGALGLQQFSEPIPSFYPVGPWGIDSLFLPTKKNDLYSIVQNSKTVHMYNELIIRAAIPKNVLPPRESFLGDYFASHGFNYKTSPSLDTDWIRGWSKNYTERKIATKLAQILGPGKNQIKKLIYKKA